MGLIIGTILSVGFDAGTTPVRGFLQCNGSAIDRTVYAELFKVIGTKWGAGDGIQTFNLPDLRGVFMRGASDGTGTDYMGSIEFYATALPPSGKLSAAVNSRHHHPVPQLAIDSPWYQTAGAYYTAWNDNGVTVTSEEGLHHHQVSGGDNETRPVNVYVDYVIYTGVLI
jgi:microcystin-dependent protein